MINVGYILKNKKVHRMIKKQSQKPETKTKKKKTKKNPKQNKYKTILGNIHSKVRS